MEITSAQICEDLMALTGRTKAGLAELSEEMQLTPIQVISLYLIKRGEATTGRIAYALHCDASNVTGIVDRLVAQKLIVRHENEQDRRTKMLELTGKGRRTVDTVMSKLPGYLGCDKLNSSERNSLHKVISKIGS